MSNYLTGTIKKYFQYDHNAEPGKKGGYGFITNDQDQVDYFFFGKDSSIHQKNIKEGIRVTFKTITSFNPKKGVDQIRAIDIKRL